MQSRSFTIFRPFTLLLFITGAVAADPSAGFPELEKRAEKGDVDTLIELGMIYRDGKRAPKDYAKALMWYEKAAATGDAKAQDHLGWMYYLGHGTKQDYTKAFELFTSSAKQGHHQGQFNLGMCYAEGLGVEQNYQTGAAWWRKAIKNGNKYAPYRLSLLHLYGFGVPRNPEKAIELCRASAQHDFFPAKLLLGLFHENGVGVPVDSAKADKYWTSAYDEEKSDYNVDMFAWRNLKTRKAEAGQFAFIHLPHIQQGYNNCAATAAAIALGADGNIHDPYRVKKDCTGSRTGYGTDWSLLIEAIEKQNRKAKIVTFKISDAGLEEGLTFLKNKLDQDEPVLIDIHEPETQSRSAHTAVAVGYDHAKKRLYLHDPAIGFPGVRYLTYERLDLVWRSRWYTHKATERTRPIIVIENP